MAVPCTDPDKLAQMRGVFERITPLSDASWQSFATGLTVLHLEVGECVIRPGDQRVPAAYVHRGLLQAVYSGEDGRDFIHAFIADGSFASAYAAAITGRPPKSKFEALEPSELWCFDAAGFRRLADQHADWCRIGRVLVEQEYLLQVDRIEELLAANAGERLSRFMAKNQRLLPRLQQQHIARYLGVTSETLSRLRKQRSRS